MDSYFKLCRAREELDRIRLEAKRLLTFITDEELFLRKSLASLTATNPDLAFQLDRRLTLFTSINHIHYERLRLFGIRDNSAPGLIPGKAKFTSNLITSMDLDGELQLDGDGDSEEGSGSEVSDAGVENMNLALDALELCD